MYKDANQQEVVIINTKNSIKIYFFPSSLRNTFVKNNHSSSFSINVQ